MKTHKDLMVWKKSIDFVTRLYRLTESFPDSERYGLTNQLRRAAVSIPSNIAEGAARSSDKEFVKFLFVSRASAVEIETQLIIANNLGFDIEGYEELNNELNAISRMITSLINRIIERIN